MLVAQSGRKLDNVGPKEAWGLVTVLDGELNAEKLAEAFKKTFLWGENGK